MLKAELLEIIANGENSGVQFKRENHYVSQPAEGMENISKMIERQINGKISF